MKLNPETIGQIINWIIKNRKGAAFRGYSRNKIYQEIMESIEHEVFRFTYNNLGLTGIVCGTRDDDKKSLYIYDILVITHGALRVLLKNAEQSYPNYQIFGKVRERKRHFKDLNKLTRRIK